MDISETQLWDEVQEVIEEGERPVHYEYGCAVMFEEEATKPLKLLEVSVERDYRHKSADVTYLRLLMGRGMRDHLLYNEREGLLLVMWKKRVGEVHPEVDESDEAPEEAEDIEHFFYRGALRTLKFGVLEGESAVSDKPEDADLTDQVTVDIQVYPLVVEELRTMSTGGIFKEETPGDVLLGLLTHALAQTETTTDPIVKGVDMVDADNEEERERVIVPQGTPVMELPDYLQEQMGGIYDHGIGSYIQGEYWYIWPLYHLHRVDDVEETMTLINIPENRLPGIERSYYTKDGAIVILSTNRARHIDVSQRARSNLGKGFRYLKSGRAMDEFRELSPDGESWKIEVDRKENAEEMVYDPSTDVHQKLGSPHPTRTKQNLIVNSPMRASSNPHYHSSKIAERVGSLLMIGWDNSRPDLVYPGMPVTYVFLLDDKPVQLEGVVVGHNFTTVAKNAGLRTSNYSTISELLIYVQSPEYIQDLEPSTIELDEDTDPPIPNVGN